MAILFVFRSPFSVFVVLFVCCSPVLSFPSDESNGTSTVKPVSAPLKPQQVVENQQDSDGLDGLSRTVREAGVESAGNATAADAGSVGNGTVEDATSTTIDWWSSLATQSPVVQRDSAASASNSSAPTPAPPATPNSTLSSADNSTAVATTAKNGALPRLLQLFTLLLIALGAMAATIF